MTDDTAGPEQAETESGTGPAPKPRRWRKRWIVRGVFLVLFSPLLFGMATFILLLGREVTAPSWVTRGVEARAAEILPGGELTFRDIKVTVGEDLHPRVVLRDAVLRDADGAVLSRIQRVESLISPRGVLQRRLLAQEVALTGTQLNLRRESDGRVALSFDTGGGEVGASENFLGLLDQVDTLFEAGPLEALETVSARGLIINYTDGRSGRSWTVDDGELSLDLRREETVLRGSVALLAGRDFVTRAELTYRSPRGSSEAELGVTLTEAAATDLASQVPQLAWLGVLDAPISGAMRTEIDAEGALTGLNATLQIGAGQVRPGGQARPVPFDGARTYLNFSPGTGRLTFDLIEVQSAWIDGQGRGHAYLRDLENGWPEVVLAQLDMSGMQVNPADLYPEPLALDRAVMDLRIHLDPFAVEIGEAVLQSGETPITLSGRIDAVQAGWRVALAGRVAEIGSAGALALWPEQVTPRTRDWIARNLSAGMLRDLALDLRATAGEQPRTALTFGFDGAEIRVLPEQPAISGARGELSLVGRRLALQLSEGTLTAPQGGRLDLAGTRFVVPRTGAGAQAEIDLTADGTVTAALSVLAAPPFNALRGGDLPPDFADGRMSARVRIETPLGLGVTPDQRVWSAEARLRDLRSADLVPDRVLTAQTLDLRADPGSLTIRGPVQLGAVAAEMTFARALGAGSEGTGRVEARVAISPESLRELGIVLPAGMVSGAGTGDLVLTLDRPGAPAYALRSTLSGIGLSLPSLGWAKARASNGDLQLSGRLGPVPSVDRFALQAAGLQARGTITLAPGGGLERAAFERVRVGNWLDVPVVLIGRGQGRPARVQVAGGVLDLRAAELGGGGESGPIDLALDRLTISDGITLNDLRAELTGDGGLSGGFRALVNDAAPIQGTLVPMAGGTGVRIRSEDAGAVFRAAGLLRGAAGGSLDMVLRPVPGAEGTFDGSLAAENLRVRDAPALAGLLDAISVVGLISQLDGQGLLFNEVEAQFRLTPTRVIVTQSSAVGPGLGLSLDGVYGLASRQMDFQGVISPFYLLNGVGAVLTRPGEGLIGFNFNLRGPVDSARVTVNPLSALTPGMFREIFRRPPPSVNQ